jgi:hypothetical protein
MPTLSDIVKENALYVTNSGFIIEHNSSFEFVDCKNAKDKDECVYLQNEEATTFIEKSVKLWEETGDTTLDECMLSEMKPYIEALI